ncbi:MAG: two-component regulator propeller domain-containing protein [bacterium]
MKKLVVILSLFLLNNVASYSQNPEWIVFPFDSIGVPHGTVNSIAIDSTDNIWFNSSKYYSGGSGVIKYDGSNFTTYDTTNSDLQNNYVNTLCVDKENNLWAGHDNFKPHPDDIGGISKYENNKWISINIEKWKNPLCADIDIDEKGNLWFIDDCGLLKYNGTNWTVWNIIFFDDFPLLLMPQSIKVDHNDNVWIGTSWDEMPSNEYKGLLKFDGDTCEYFIDMYDSLDWKKPHGGYKSIAEDKDNNIWAARESWSEDGLLMVNDTGWALYDRSNSGLPCDSISKIAFDKNNIMWLATWNGLVKWDGSIWKHWHTGNSNITFNKIETLEIDRFGNIWIGGYNYLAVFREGGVILKTEDNIQKKSETVQCYPNPFSESTTIKYYLVQPTFVNLKVFDTYGRELANLENNFLNEGEHQVKFDAGNLTDGIYYYKLIIGNKVEFGKMLLIQ